MQWLQRIERKFDWLAMPGLIRYLAMLSGLVYALAWLNPELWRPLNFDRHEILVHHQYWRLLTFPFAMKGVVPSVIGLVFFVCGIMFSFMISDSLESIWGSTRTTLFVLFSWVALVITGFFFDLGAFPGSYLFSTIFLAFAAFFPHTRIYLMMILPIPVWILAVFVLLQLALTVLGNPASTLPLLLAHANLFIWVVPVMWKERGHLRKAEDKRRQFKAASLPADDAFHRCAVCNRTEHDSAHLEFRVHSDGKEYCMEHEPKL